MRRVDCNNITKKGWFFRNWIMWHRKTVPRVKYSVEGYKSCFKKMFYNILYFFISFNCYYKIPNWGLLSAAHPETLSKAPSINYRLPSIKDSRVYILHDIDFCLEFHFFHRFSLHSWDEFWHWTRYLYHALRCSLSLLYYKQCFKLRENRSVSGFSNVFLLKIMLMSS